jgi:hypothetical protein
MERFFNFLWLDETAAAVESKIRKTLLGGSELLQRTLFLFVFAVFPVWSKIERIRKFNFTTEAQSTQRKKESRKQGLFLRCNL